MSLLLAFLIIVLTMLIHEAGHFFAALAVGVKPKEFSIFLPPRLFSREWRGIKYTIGSLPIGAFVGFAERFHEEEKIWKRLIIVVAGPLANVVAFTLVFGVLFGFENTIATTWHVTCEFVRLLAEPSILIQESVGPVGIMNFGSEEIAGGRGLFLFAALNLSIALTNLLPILPLDGGHINFCIVELLCGRAARKIKGVLVLFGAFALAALIIYLTIRDIRALL